MNGILYSRELLPKVLNETKTVTRRLQGFNEINEHPDEWECMYLCPDTSEKYAAGRYRFFHHSCERDPYMYNRYLKPRYPLHSTQYIRERALYWDGGAGGCSNIAYEDDPEIKELIEDNNRLLTIRELTNIAEKETVIGKWRWRSPYHMKANQARWFQQIVDVRPERLTLALANDDFTEEGGEPAWKYLVPMFDKWVFRYEFKLLRREELPE